MSSTPEQERALLALAYEKRKQALDSVNANQQSYNEGRERQVALSEEEKSKLNILSFGIAGAVLSFSPSSMENDFVLLGMGILIFNAIVFGILASWKQRHLNIQNYENAIKDLREVYRSYFDAYDEFIRKEPFDEALWQKQVDAYNEYLEKQKEHGKEIRIAKKHPLSIGENYLWIFIAGFLLVSLGLVQKYYFGGGDIQKVQIIESRMHRPNFYR